LLSGTKMVKLVLFSISFLYTIHLTQAQIGSERVSQRHLYIEEPQCYLSDITTQRVFRNCLKSDETFADYACRYDILSKWECYCCGKFFTYIEHGEVCTKFCLKNSEQNPRYGQDFIIRLPLNYGGYPRAIRLENGTQLEVNADNFGERRLPDLIVRSLPVESSTEKSSRSEEEKEIEDAKVPTSQRTTRLPGE